MSIDDSTIQELKKILEKRQKRVISNSEASEVARAFIGYFDLLAKINSRENL